MRDSDVVQLPKHPTTDRAAKARAEHERRAAVRRAGDPAELSKAVRTVHAAASIGTLEDFIARQRAERCAKGLPEQIVDADALRLIADLVRGGDRHARTAR